MGRMRDHAAVDAVDAVDAVEVAGGGSHEYGNKDTSADPGLDCQIVSAAGAGRFPGDEGPPEIILST